MHYYVGLELSQELDSRYSVTVRALDLEDRTWVTGFGKQWNPADFSTVQRQAMRQQRVDADLSRRAGCAVSHWRTDRPAGIADLAHQLSCTLKQQLEEEYVVVDKQRCASGATMTRRRTVELIGNNLANRQALDAHQLMPTEDQRSTQRQGAPD